MENIEQKEGTISVRKYDNSMELLGEFSVDPTNNRQISEPIKDWIKKKSEAWKTACEEGGGCGGGSPMIFIKETTIGGQKAIKTSSGNILGLQIHYIIPYQGKIIIISLQSIDNKFNTPDNFDEGSDELARAYQKMLSSFRFK